MTTTPNPTTFSLNIENKSSYADNEVFIQISGKNAALDTWFYLSGPSAQSLTEFDDTPATLLKKEPNGAFLGNEKYFIKLTDLHKVSASDHLYSMDVPREHLYSGRIYLSFGSILPGVGITAPGYAFALDGNGQPTGAGTPVTSSVTAKGDSDSTGTSITGLTVDATKVLYAGEPVSGAGVPAGTVVSSIVDAHSIKLNNAITKNAAAQSLTFTPPPFSKLSLQGPSFSGSPDYLIPFEFMELSATTDLTVKDPYYTLYANTSVVDFFSIGLGMEVSFEDGSTQSVGFEAGIREQLLGEFNGLDSGSAGFMGYVLTDGKGGGSLSFDKKAEKTSDILRVLGPQNIIQLNPAGALVNFLQTVIDDTWATYAQKALNIPDNLPGHNPYGFKYTGTKIGKAATLDMTCTEVPAGKTGNGDVFNLPKPSTDIVFKCDDTAPPPNSYSNSGTNAHKRLGSFILAAINRGVFDDYAKWSNDLKGATTFYKRSDKKYNIYAHILHEHALNGKVYGFGYDDIYGQDPTIAGPIGKCTSGAKPPGEGITKVTVKIPSF